MGLTLTVLSPFWPSFDFSTSSSFSLYSCPSPTEYSILYMYFPGYSLAPALAANLLLLGNRTHLCNPCYVAIDMLKNNHISVFNTEIWEEMNKWPSSQQLPYQDPLQLCARPRLARQSPAGSWRVVKVSTIMQRNQSYELAVLTISTSAPLFNLFSSSSSNYSCRRYGSDQHCGWLTHKANGVLWSTLWSHL